MSGDPLWTVREVMAYLQVSRSWVYQRAESGQLPCLRVGGLLRFEPVAIRAWVARCASPGAVLSIRR